MTFGEAYASYYDEFYADKDYSRECDLISRTLSELRPAAKAVLDLGCGTGGHAYDLASRGFDVVGLDLSEPMLHVARSKAAAWGGTRTPHFCQGDIASFQLRRTFDAAIMMFAVIGYQTTNDKLIAALRSAASHLVPGGLLVFDCWYGPAVLAERPSDRVLVRAGADRTLVRVSRTEIDRSRQICRVDFTTWAIQGSGLTTLTEQHDMRYFFDLEIDLALRLAGFEHISTGSVRDPASPPTEADWNAFVVAKRPAGA